MISKAKLKELSTYRMQKVCVEEGLFVVEGVKMCDEALMLGLPIATVCASRQWLESRGQQLGASEGMLILEASDEELERISLQRSPNQVWMLIRRNFKPAVEAPEGGCILALDHLQDPGNMGTIIRTADWFGIRQIVCSNDTVSCFNPKVVQSTMGGLFRTHISYTDLPSYLAQAKGEGYKVFGALLDGSNVYQTPIQPGRNILVIGNESKGITPEVQQLVDQRLLIPNLGGTCESLNAAVATAILCSEMMRSQAR